MDLLLEDAQGVGDVPRRVEPLRYPELLHAPLARLIRHPEAPKSKIHKPR